MKEVLVTGAAGFIGSFVCKSLLEHGDRVVGLDNLNAYYDTSLKYGRLGFLGINIKDGASWNEPERSDKYGNFSFVRMNLEDKEEIQSLFAGGNFDTVINLAAQAGVRYSIQNPHAYVESNICGFLNILEGCRNAGVKHLVYASSSSVYGLNGKVPFSEHDGVAHPVSIYAATKRADELMAHVYSHLYGLPCTGLRFFTVYGPWGRPDMAPFLFADAILRGRPINVFNNGEMLRDFTYIDDIVEGIVRIADRIPKPDAKWNADSPNPASSPAPYRLYNIGNSSPVKLMDFIEAIENAAGCKAEKNFLPIQPGDVCRTFADTADLQTDTGFRPNTPVSEGIEKTVRWFRGYYNL